MAGMAHGITYVTLINHAGEIASHDNRGRVLATINCMLFFGCGVFTITHYANANTADAFYLNRLFSIIALALSLVALLVTPCLTLESPTFLLHIQDDRKAMMTMMKLRSINVETDSLNADLNELQAMVVEDFDQPRNIFSGNNVAPLLMSFGCRILAIMVNNWVLNIIQIILIQKISATYPQLAPAILIGVRFVISLVPNIIADFSKRLKVFTFLFVLTLFVLIVIAILIATLSDATEYVLLAFIVLFQMVVVGIDVTQHIIVAEAFGLNKKIWSITLVVTAEYLLHIAIISIFYNISISNDIQYGVAFATVAIILIVGVFLHYSIPETVGLTLRQSRDVFRNFKWLK